MPRGRPRSFDRDLALRHALGVFWERGYQGASIAALTEAMGIAAPSLYAAFGSKAGLFREATRLYMADDGAEPARVLEAGETARSSVEALLRAEADLFTQEGGPAGCMLTRAVGTYDDDDPELKSCLDETVEQRIRDIEQRLERGVGEGEALPCEEVCELAEYIDAVVQGMAVRAMEGASRATLHRIVDMTMRAWPVAPIANPVAQPSARQA